MMPGAEPVPAAKDRGCLFYAGAAAAVLAAGAVLSVALLLAGTRSLLRTYTGTSPVVLPASSLPEAESEALAARFKRFKESVGRSPSAAPLVLGDVEINALIARDPRLKDLAGKVHISLSGDAIKARMSVPLDESGIPFVRGRYLNGEVAVKGSLDDGILIIAIDSIVLNDKTFSEAVMSALRSENLARDIYRRPKTAEALRKFESIRVKDGLLTVTLR